MRPLLLLKRIICRLGFGDLLGEFCEACGRTVSVVWRAPDEKWRAVIGAETGVRCVECFDAVCYARGEILRWAPTVAHVRGTDGEWLVADGFVVNVPGRGYRRAR